MNTVWMSALRISIIYVIIGGIWIITSDQALSYFFSDKQTLVELQTIKGWFFIIATGLILFWLVYRQLRNMNEAEERLRYALNASGDGVWDWDVPSSKVWYSKQLQTMLGYADGEFSNSLDEWSSRVHPDDLALVMEDLQRHLDGKTDCYINEHRMRCKNGHYKWIRDSGLVITRDEHGKPIRLVGTHADITTRKEADEKLKLANTVFTHAYEGILVTDTDNKIIEVNDAFTRITGYSREDVIGKSPKLLQSGKHSPTFYEEMWHSIKTEGYWSGEVSNIHKNGQPFIEMLTISEIRDADGNAVNYVALFSDITHIRAQQIALERLASYDPLTSLPNRILLADRLKQSMAQCQRHQQLLAVAFIDLDGFKQVNDIYGHEVGDKLLVTISNRMKAALREGDTLARIGGDEFIAVLTELNVFEDCESVIERLLTASSEPISIDDKTFSVSASIGVTLFPEDSVDADILMRHADHAMYTAKQLGKNRYHLFDVNQDDAIRLHRKQLLDIELALKNDEFVMHFQPIVNMRTGSVIGLEALLRWQSPEEGLLTPGAFLPYIENNPISVNLGEWVIHAVLKQISQWQAAQATMPDIISINISALQIGQTNFADRLASLLNAYPEVDPHKIELEVLETSALEDIQNVSNTMNACAQLGVKFAIDDFGTGYSSLTYLKHLPAEIIKIDQSFVRDMLIDEDDLAIVKGVIGLANAFQRGVIAEGVESAEHGKALLELGCELAQGFGIAKPMPAERVPEWIEGWKPQW